MTASFDVSQFGIVVQDEYTHPSSPDHPDWNESYFFDWYNEDATFAGHCRVGWHPGQDRVVNLQLEAVAPPHSRGAGEVESHSAQGYSTNRYEQPIRAHCNATIDGLEHACQVRGERDHSWGPRPGDMEWSFLVINNKDFSLQATVVKIPEWPAIKMGYFKSATGEMLNFTDVDFQIEYNADNPERAVQGRIYLTCENETVISADVNAVTGTEIDITHTFDTPKRTECRRSLVSCQFHGEQAGIVNPGWFECNRNANNQTVDND